MSKATELISYLKGVEEQLGLGGSPEGDGGSMNCVCIDCGYSEPHDRGIPCNKKTCSKCGTQLVGKRGQ